MLGLFKNKDNHQEIYKEQMFPLYAQALTQARQPFFYADYKVPDTLEARFDILALHVILIMNRQLQIGQDNAQALNQALFDVFFTDMDQTLREMGIGDMGVPKRMRRYMTAFNSRIHTLSQAFDLFEKGEKQNAEDHLTPLLEKNIYNQSPLPPESTELTGYIFSQYQKLKDFSEMQILNTPLFQS